MVVTKAKIKSMLAAAEEVFADSVARAARFADSKDFKRSLVKALDKHVDFSKASQDLHAHVRQGLSGAKSQIARKMTSSGRVQAPRHDSPRG